jgi:hypothetical protein
MAKQGATNDSAKSFTFIKSTLLTPPDVATDVAIMGTLLPFRGGAL